MRPRRDSASSYLVMPSCRCTTQHSWGPKAWIGPKTPLVIGLELDGDAKAYPVSFLNRREMVIDWIGGTPVLVTW